MKRIIFISILLSVTAFTHAGNNGYLGKSRTKKITSYFADRINGKEAKHMQNKNIAVENIEEARSSVWSCWRNTVKDTKEEKLISPVTKEEPRDTGYWKLPDALEPNAIMPYYLIKKGDKPSDGYPLYLYMHGSGLKEREWESGYRLCCSFDDTPSIHFVPQIPNGYGELYRWAIQSKQWAWEKLFRLAFVEEGINPNRIYFFGISEGGYGSQRLASFYADYLAGAGPMAGGEPLKNAPMENLANIAFSLRTGEHDYGFARNVMTQNAAYTIDSLAKAHPGLYNNFIEIVPGMGHGINYEKTTPWLSQFSRNANPTYFYWEDYDMYGRHRTGFYNIKINETSRNNDEERTCYEMSIDDNTVNLTVNNVTYTTTQAIYNIPMFFSRSYTPATKGNITIYLSEKHFDFTNPIKVVVNGKEVFNSKVKPNLKAMVESCAEYFDPERVYPAAIDIEIK